MLTQRWDLDRHDAQSIVEVLAEGALLDGAGQVPMRGREHAHIDLNFAVAPHWADLALFEHAAWPAYREACRQFHRETACPARPRGTARGERSAPR